MILNSFSLRDKVAIVTGSNRGLGQGMALGLAEAGAHIVGVSSSESGMTQKLVKEMGRDYLPIQADLSSLKPISSIVEETVKTFGKLDILINNAGTIKRNEAVDFTEEEWDYVMNVNLKSLFFLSQAAARQFLKQRTGGKIINIASMLSFQGGIRVSSYTASKSGVMGLTRILSNEWAGSNINVNAIAPGYMATDNTAPLREDPERNRAILERIPQGRWGTPDDLKGAAVFLSSSASNYINGYTLAVDGGWLGR